MMICKIFYVFSGNIVYINMNDGREMLVEVYDLLCVSEVYEIFFWIYSEKIINLIDIYIVEFLGSGDCYNLVWFGFDCVFKKCYVCYC